MPLDMYRNKALNERASWNIQEWLNLWRTAVLSESALEVKLFVQFVALIYLSYSKKLMSEKDRYENYTMIEAFENPESTLRVGKVEKKQARLFNTLGVMPRPRHNFLRI